MALGSQEWVEIAAGREQHGAGFEVQLTEVAPLFLG
jgi:hypothetical protein